MMLPLKTLSKDAIPTALVKADRYRLLNEPLQAESICLDILAVEPENQNALVILLLALSDQIGHGYRLAAMEPADVIGRLKSEYERAYYAGIVDEHRAKAVLDQSEPHSGFLAYDLLTSAMAHYERAETLRPAGNDDALLRWNTCARLMNSHGVKPRQEERDSFLE
jgi:hypothetical protein